jgi:2-polyprenyl-6-hydroxyphenyl methylase/3-demethylubiquinone-9 3-methyltransferase
MLKTSLKRKLIKSYNHMMMQQRFGFGKNWLKYIELMDEDRIHHAIESLAHFLGEKDLHGKIFLDIGSGSGLSSLAAYRMGATVYSFDYDPNSVLCTEKLRQMYAPTNDRWTIQQGDVLDQAYLQTLPKADIVYSWGVLHHTGQMWQALANVATLVKPHGKLFLSIYNDQGRRSRIWRRIKKFYNQSSPLVKKCIEGGSLLWLWKYQFLLDTISHLNPLKHWHQYAKERGMSPWYDLIDWVGGYPFEVAKPEEIFHFFKERGYVLERLKTCGGGLGCNEFIFIKGL